MKSTIINNCSIYLKGKFVKKSLYIENGVLKNIDNEIKIKADQIFDLKNKILIPGLIDVHVHLRQPGYEYKETIKTGTKAAAAGGYTTVCCMPNLIPEIDSLTNIKKLLNLIDKDASINVLPYASITKNRKGDGKVVDMQQLSNYCFAFSDDGTGVKTEKIMLEAMKNAKKVNKTIVAHSEDLSLIPLNACVHEGKFSSFHNLIGIPSSSEYKQIERDIKLANKIKCKYHVCHISCKESVQLIKKAHKLNKNITCEVTPHHLLLNETNISSNDGKFKMNPPLRSTEDQKALINGIKNNSIQIIATDHAPHSKKEKSLGLQKSSFGVVGLDFTFPLLYTKLVKSKIISLKKLIQLMSINPSKIFSLPSNELKLNQKVNFMVFDPNKKQKIDPKKFFSKGKSTPFENVECFGWPILTFCNGDIVYKYTK